MVLLKTIIDSAINMRETRRQEDRALGQGDGTDYANVPSILAKAREMCPPDDDVLELDPRNALRVLVPTSNWRVRRAGSQLYPALSWKGRVHRAALRSWITLGGGRFTFHVSAARAGTWPLGDLLVPDMPTLSTASVSVSPQARGRKVTAQLMDERGRILGFIKYADSPLARARILNEARMLETLPENVGPRLIRFTPFMGGDLLIQTPLPGRSRAPRLRLDTAQMSLLERLMQPGKSYTASEHPFIEALRAETGEHENMLESIVAALDNIEWPLVYMHGDLAPWNMRWRRGECLAFDWECGSTAGFPYLDAAYTLVLVASLIQRIDPWQAKQVVSNRLKVRLPIHRGEFASAIAGLSAVYTLVSWYPPKEHSANEPDEHERWLRTFIEATP